ncbi:MAG: hypothetical protein ACNA7W_07160 [Pseudomonadales bacterium]
MGGPRIDPRPSQHPRQPLRVLALGSFCGMLLGAMAACGDPAQQTDVAEPEPRLDPTETGREPLREGLSEPPEHRQPLDLGEPDPRDVEGRLERREQSGDPRTEEDLPQTPTEQPLPVDEPIPAAADDRPEGLDPRDDPAIDTDDVDPQTTTREPRLPRP